jgi:hypothetical protein
MMYKPSKAFEMHAGYRAERSQPIKTEGGKYKASAAIKHADDQQGAVLFFLSHEYMRPVDSEDTACQYALALGGVGSRSRTASYNPSNPTMADDPR